MVPCLKQHIRTGYLRGIWSNGAAPALCWGKESSGSTRTMSTAHAGAGGPKPAPRHAVLEPSLAPQCHHPLCKEIQRVAASLVQPAAPRMASDAPQSTVAPWHRARWAQPPGVPALLGAARRRRGAGASFLGADPSKRTGRKSCGHHRAWPSIALRGDFSLLWKHGLGSALDAALRCAGRAQHFPALQTPCTRH